MPNETHPRMIARIKLLLFAYCAGLVCYLTLTAWRMNVDFYDAFYILYNAKSLAIGAIDPFRFTTKVSLLPLLLSPIYHLEKILHYPRLLMFVGKTAIISCLPLLLFMSYKILSLYNTKMIALLGVFFLATNHLLIFLAPFIKEDIPAALTMTTAIYYYLTATRDKCWNRYLLSAVFIAITIILRVHIALIFPPIIASYEILSGQVRLRWVNRFPQLAGGHILKKIVVFFILPVVLSVLYFSTMEAFIQKIPFLLGMESFFVKLLTVYKQLATDDDSSLSMAFGFLLNAFTWPLILTAFIGFFSSLKKDQNCNVIFHIWFIIFVLVMAIVIPHLEARYFFPAFVPVCFFAAKGVEWCVNQAHTLVSKRFFVSRILVAALVGLLVVICPLQQLVRAHLRFQDPIYQSHFIQDLAGFVQQKARGKQIYWVGAMFPLHPKDYIFHKGDMVTYIHHVHEHTLFYYMDQKLKLLHRTAFIIPGAGESGVFVPDLASLIEDGEILIVNPASKDYVTKDMPKTLDPLVVESVQKGELEILDATAEHVRLKADHPFMLIELQAMGDGFVIKGTSSVNGAFQLTLYQDDRENVTWLDVIEVVDGRISRERPGKPMPKFNKGFVLSYKLERLFFHP